MSIDPDLAAALQRIAVPQESPATEVTAHDVRAAGRAATVGTRRPHEVVAVAAVEDVGVPGGAGEMGARVYRPFGDGPLPTVAFLHGGGWVSGDLDTHDNIARDIARGSGAVVVSVDYRLAPEHPFPAAVDDAIAATRWIAQNTGRFGGDGAFGLAGDSAGGNLAAVASHSLRDSGARVDAVLLLYPVTDPTGPFPSRTEFENGYVLNDATIRWLFAQYAGTHDDHSDPRIAPLLSADLSGLAPAVIATAALDPLRDDGEAYATALREAGVEVYLRRYDGMVHGFFDMGRWSPVAQSAIDQVTLLFGEALRRHGEAQGTHTREKDTHV